MAKWEYLILNRVGGSWNDDRFDARNPAERLTDLGAESWELVSVGYDGGGYNFYLKRLIEEKVTASAKKSKSKAKTNSAPTE